MWVTVDKAKIEAFVSEHKLGTHRDFARRAGISDAAWYRIWNQERGVGSGVISKVLHEYRGTQFETFFKVAHELPGGNKRVATTGNRASV